MKQSILILSNSNVFTVFSQVFLKKWFPYHLLNLRYSNEEMDRNEHYIQQIKELFHDFHYQKGLLHSRYDFSLSERLLYRINQAVIEQKTTVILFEMKLFSDAEWSLLQYFRNTYDIPIVAFIPSEKKSKNNMFRLAEHGVKEVITQLNEEIFISVMKRNFRYRSL